MLSSTEHCKSDDLSRLYITNRTVPLLQSWEHDDEERYLSMSSSPLLRRDLSAPGLSYSSKP